MTDLERENEARAALDIVNRWIAASERRERIAWRLVIFFAGLTIGAAVQSWLDGKLP